MQTHEPMVNPSGATAMQLSLLPMNFADDPESALLAPGQRETGTGQAGLPSIQKFVAVAVSPDDA